MRFISPIVSPDFRGLRLTSDLEKFFEDDFFDSFSRQERSSLGQPGFELVEGEDHFLLSLDMPGMKRDEIHIEVAENTLAVSGERRREAQHEKPGKKISSWQREYGSFQHRFALPSSVDSSKIEARQENGVLEVYLPKTAASSKRRIEVQSGRSGVFEKLLSFKDPSPTKAN